MTMQRLKGLLIYYLVPLTSCMGGSYILIVVPCPLIIGYLCFIILVLWLLAMVKVQMC